MSDPGTAVDVRREGDKVVVNFAGATVTDEQTRRLDVLDFATPVSTIDVLRAGGDTRLVIAASGSYEELAYQSDNVFTRRDPAEVVEAEEGTGQADAVQPGPGVHRRTPDAELPGHRNARGAAAAGRRQWSQRRGVSDTVQGNVTLRLQNVPWDQALDIVLAAKGLDMRENGNVIIVAPAEEIAARELADLESRQEISRAGAAAPSTCRSTMPRRPTWPN